MKGVIPIKKIVLGDFNGRTRRQRHSLHNSGWVAFVDTMSQLKKSSQAIKIIIE